MKLFPATIEIDRDEGFSEAKDIFDRKKIGEGLTHLVQSVEDPLVIAIDGAWGSGKTTFLKMWRGELGKLGFPVIYFDAFANDYFDDAFIPIAAEIVGLAKDKLTEKSGKLQEIKSRAAKVARIVATSGLKIGLKVGTLGVLDAADLENAIAKEIDTVLDKHMADLISRKDAAMSDMEAFREALQNLPALLTADSKQGDQPKPIIIIVDELDRCRPSYALQFLERMKHFFCVKGVHFVLGTNLDQLANSVVATYGAGIDGRLYLQKFVQLSIHIHDRFEFDGVTTASKFLAHLLNQSKLVGEALELVRDCNNEIARISRHRNFSLRTLEHIYGHTLRVAAILPKNQFRNAALISGLCVLKVTEPTLFAKAKAGKLEYSELFHAFALLDSNNPKFNTNGNGYESQLSEQNWFEHWWRFVADKNCPDEMLRAVENGMWSFSFRDRFSLLPFCANDQVDRLHLA